MKMLKKIMAVVIVAVMMLGVVSVTASAATATPKFSYAVKSQTNTSVVIEFSYVSGGFNSFDVKFVPSGNIGECTAIKTTSDFNKIRMEYGDQYEAVSVASNPKTAMFSIASTKTFDRATSICTVTFAKKKAVTVTSKECSVVFSSCVVTSGANNVDVTSKVSVSRADAGYIKFESDAISGNYKDTQKIKYTSNYSAKQIKWSSSNEKVAKVDDQGNVTMTGKGTATITATSTDGVATAQCTVKVGYSTLQWIIIIVLFGWIWYI